MSKLIYRGDAEDFAQQTLLPNPPAGFIGEIKVGISNKTITVSEWNKEAVATAFNGAGIPEFDAAVASVTDDGVLLTAATAGIPFQVWISYGGSSTFDEVLIFSKLNYSATVSGTIDLTFKGETVAVNYDVNAASLQAALETLTAIDPGDTTIVDLNPTQIKMTWSGQYAGQNVTDLTIDDSALRGGTADVVVTKVRDYRAGQNEIQRIVLGGGPTGGTILYDLDGTPIGPVNYNDAVADYQTAFDAALGAGEATVTGPSGTGEVGPLQTEAFVATHDKDTGYSYDPATSQVVKVDKAAITIGNEQIVSGGDAIWRFPRTAFLLVKTDAAIPANLQIERAVLQLAVLSSSFNARVDVVIRAVDQASPARIIEGDWADFSTRPLTTASVNWTAVVSPNNTTIQPPSLHTIVQELIDTHGAVSEIMFYLETQSNSIGSVTFYEPGESGYITTPDPTLLVDYRDSGSGPDVFDVEFIGGRSQISLPLMTANIDALVPKRQNTIWEIDTVLETGASINAPGVLQLYDGATQLQTAGTSEAGVIFVDGLATVLDEQFGPDNYTYRTNVDGEPGRVEIELIEELSGAVDISDDLLLYWTPIFIAEVPEGNPVARMELINDGGSGLGERQRFVVEESAISGTLVLTDGLIISGELPYNLTAAQLQTALELFAGAGKVTCSGTASPQGILCEFDVTVGDFSEPDIINNLRSVGAVVVDQVFSNNDADTAVTSTITVDMIGPIIGGSWDLIIYPSQVGIGINVPVFIPDNVTGAAAQYIHSALITAIPQATAVSVTGTTLSEFTIVITAPFTVSASTNGSGLIGTQPIVEWQLLNEYEASANERQRLVVDDGEFAGGGYIELTYEGVTVTAFYPAPNIWGVLAQIPALNGSLVVRPAPDYGAGAWEIEFVGSLAGTDVNMISVASYLTGFEQQGYLTAYWSRSQYGSNGASVTITELQDGSPPLGSQSLVRITNNPHFGTFTLTDGFLISSAFQYDAATSLIQTNLVAGGFIVTCIGELADGLLCSFPASEGAVILSANNIDLTNARFSGSESIRGGELNTLELQRSVGKNHFDDPLNWKVIDTGGSRIPDSGDEPIFETGRVPCLYGLKQRTTFGVDIDTEEVVLAERADFRVGQKLMVSTDDTLPTGLASNLAYTIKSYDRDSRRLILQDNGVDVLFSDLGTGTHTIRLAVNALTHHSRFTAPIGLPHFNPAGYLEYLPTQLDIGFDPAGERLLIIGEGNGSSSGRIRLDFGNDQFNAEVQKTGGAIEVGVPALTINGTNDQNEYAQHDGSVGLGFFEGDEYRFTKLWLHAGSLLYGLIISSVNCDLRNYGGTIDGREGRITGKIASKS